MKIGPNSLCRGLEPSHFDVWRQPPIMESIIARHSLSFYVPFSLEYRRGSPFSPPRVEFSPFPSPVQKANKSYLCLLHVSVKEEDLFRTGRNYPVERSHGDSIPRKVRPVQVKVHPRVQGCRYYHRIIYANYLQRTRISRKQDPNCQYVLISFGREPIDRVPA